MINKYIDIKRIEFVVTNYCTGRCEHCSVGDSLNTGHRCVNTGNAVSSVKWLAENYELDSVMTFGGEPLLFPETVCAIHKAASDAGVPKRQLITNSFFSKDIARITEVADMLKTAGVNEILLSVDAFHQQHIPVEPVLAFARAVMETGIYLRLSPAWLVNKNHDNPYNVRTKELLARFIELGIPEGSGNDIFMAGNAVKNLAHYYPAPELDFTGKCGSQPYTAPPTEVTSISIEPDGGVTVCAFNAGNINADPIERIFNRYDPYADKAMCALMDRGVEGLLDIARERNIPVDISKCYSICDVCHSINRK